jgi:hypothetical protein
MLLLISFELFAGKCCALAKKTVAGTGKQINRGDRNGYFSRFVSTSGYLTGRTKSVPLRVPCPLSAMVCPPRTEVSVEEMVRGPVLTVLTTPVRLFSTAGDGVFVEQILVSCLSIS